MDIHKTTQCAPHAFRPNASWKLSKSIPSALQRHSNSHNQMCVDHSPPSPPPAIATKSYSSTITHPTPLFGSSQIRSPQRSPQPTNRFRPKLTTLDTKWNNFGAIMAAESMTSTVSDRCSLVLGQHTNRVIPWITIRMVLLNEWSRPSPRSTIHDDWLPRATWLLGRSSQFSSVPAPANPKCRPNDKRRPRQLSSTITNSIRDAASIWQAVSRQWLQCKVVQSSSPLASAIQLLYILTYPQAVTTWKIQPRIQAMYDGRLRAWFDYTLEGMGPSISSSKVTVGCHFRWAEECPRIMPTRRPNRQFGIPRRDAICWGNRNGWRWTSPWPHGN